MKRAPIITAILAVVVLALSVPQRASALSLALDSVATWGRFPKFCVDTYRWGDQFFNGYDTAYVKGTGYKFNGKVHMDSYLDTYTFWLPDNVVMDMRSEPTTTVGLRLTYLAVSAGYDKNISRLFGRSDYKAREQFTFGFNCSLFAFNMSFVNNTGGVNIKRFGPPGQRFDPDIDFNGLKSKYFGFDAFYFFNHKKYSQAAAFSFSRIQTRSQGSWYAGVSYYNQEFNFDFNDLPPYILAALPDDWNGYRYEAKTRNLGVKFGYGYNWVFRPKWVLGIAESPTIGIRNGQINNPDKQSTRMSFSNQLRLSVIWNQGAWFGGIVGIWDASLVHEKTAAFQNSVVTGTMMIGYRFNLW